VPVLLNPETPGEVPVPVEDKTLTGVVAQPV
jgi:hypothetical protein